MRLSGKAVFVALAAALASGAVWAMLHDWDTSGPEVAYPAPDLDPMTPETAAAEAYRLAPALLLAVYQGFAETGEEAIYDTLATAAAGDALETLYLERAGALAESGLDAAGDQVVHEMRLQEIRTRRAGETLAMDATWEVIGLVGHGEHQHVRGNTYRADLAVAPVDGAWRITGFELIGVDRSNAGTAAEAEPEWWN